MGSRAVPRLAKPGYHALIARIGRAANRGLQVGPWICLAIAIGLEIVATSLLKLSNGFQLWAWGALSMAAYAGCFWAFSYALKTIPLGVAYAIWSGVGIVFITLIGLALFGQKLNPAQWGFLGLIVVGSVGLRLTSAT